MDEITAKINDFFSFLGDKLQNFTTLSIGEQIAYVSVAVGFVLIIVSLVFFVV